MSIKAFLRNQSMLIQKNIQKMRKPNQTEHRPIQYHFSFDNDSNQTSNVPQTNKFLQPLQEHKKQQKKFKLQQHAINVFCQRQDANVRIFRIIYPQHHDISSHQHNRLLRSAMKRSLQYLQNVIRTYYHIPICCMLQSEVRSLLSAMLNCRLILSEKQLHLLYNLLRMTFQLPCENSLNQQQAILLYKCLIKMYQQYHNNIVQHLKSQQFTQELCRVYLHYRSYRLVKLNVKEHFDRTLAQRGIILGKHDVDNRYVPIIRRCIERLKKYINQQRQKGKAIMQLNIQHREEMRKVSSSPDAKLIREKLFTIYLERQSIEWINELVKSLNQFVDAQIPFEEEGVSSEAQSNQYQYQRKNKKKKYRKQQKFLQKNRKT